MAKSIEPKRVVASQRLTYNLSDVTSFIRQGLEEKGFKIKSATWNEKNTQLEVIADKQTS